MWWKKGAVLVLIIFFISVTLGIIVVYDRLPQSVVGKSGFKIYCSKNPLEVKVETAGYDVYLLNGKVFSNIKEDATSAFSKLMDGVKGGSKKVNKETNDNDNNIIDNVNNNSINDSQNNGSESNEINTDENDNNNGSNGEN